MPILCKVKVVVGNPGHVDELNSEHHMTLDLVQHPYRHQASVLHSCNLKKVIDERIVHTLGITVPLFGHITAAPREPSLNRALDEARSRKSDDAGHGCGEEVAQHRGNLHFLGRYGSLKNPSVILEADKLWALIELGKYI